MSRRHKDEPAITLFSFQDIMSCLVGVLVLVALLIAMEGLRAEERVSTARTTKAAQTETAAEAQAQADGLRKEVEALQKELAARQGGADVTQDEVRVLEARVQQSRTEGEQLHARLRGLVEQEAQQKARAAELARQQAELARQITDAQMQERRQRVVARPGEQQAQRPFLVEVAANGIRVGDLDAQQTPVLASELPSAATDAEVLQALLGRSAAEQYPVLVVHQECIARFDALRKALLRGGYQVGWQLWDSAQGPFLERAP